MWRRLRSGEGHGIVYMAVIVGVLLLTLALDSSGTVLYQQNEFVVCALFFAVLVGVTEACYKLGHRTQAEASEAIKAHANEIQTAMLAVLGLLLAFTFTMAISHFDSRKQALVEETDAIDTAYLRSQLLPQPQRTAEGKLLRQYVDLRLASGLPNW
jgi:hypothetical protein